MKIKIEKDLFNISKRITKINRDYYIVFDKVKNVFQIYEKNNLLLTLPFKTLDERALKFIYERIRKSNFEILEEIEKHNQKLDKYNQEKVITKSIECAEKILRRS